MLHAHESRAGKNENALTVCNASLPIVDCSGGHEGEEIRIARAIAHCGVCAGEH